MLAAPPPHAITANTAELFAAVQRAAVVATDTAHTIHLAATQGRLTITAHTPPFGEARESAPSEITSAPAPTAFDARMLADGLLAIDADKVTIEPGKPYARAKLSGAPPARRSGQHHADS